MSQKITFAAAPRKTKTVVLPSYEGSEVEVYTSLEVGQQRELTAKFPNAADKNHPDAMNSSFGLIIMSIKRWNFADADGNDLAPSEDIINQMSTEDLKVLLEAATGKSLDELAKAAEKKS